MTLVELICAVAIMSLVGASVAGVMVVSANTYSRGAEDAELQETAQLLANQVNNLIQDALTVKLGTKSDGSSDDSTHLIVTKSQKTYDIYLDDSDETVYYKVSDSSSSEAVPMAEDVKYFNCDITDFSESGIVRMYICIGNESHCYAGNYTAASRNAEVTSKITPAEITMNYIPEYVLEPNQEYPLTAETSDGKPVEWSILTDTDSLADGTGFGEDTDTGEKTFIIGNDEKNEIIYLSVCSSARKSDGVTPKIQYTIPVYVRRVNSVSLTYENKTTGTTELKSTAGNTYSLKAEAIGTNLDSMKVQLEAEGGKDPGYDSSLGGFYDMTDSTAINTRDVVWEVEVSNGTTIYETSDYLENISYSESIVNGTPYFNFTLKKDLADGDMVKITATSKHAVGQVTDKSDSSVKHQSNYTGINYSNLVETWVLYKSIYSLTGQSIYRASDNPEQGTIYPSIIKNLIASRYGWNYVNSNGISGDSDLFRAHRFREVTLNADGSYSYGPWTNWRYTGSSSQQDKGSSLNMRPDASKSLECDKTYEVQFRLFVLDNSGNQIWPFDDSAESEYIIDGIVDPVNIYFSSNYFTDEASAYTSVTTAGAECRIWVSSITGIKDEANNKYVSFTIQRQNSDGTWSNVTTYSDRNNGNMNADGVYYSVNGGNTSSINSLVFDRAGYYRVLVSYVDVPYTKYVPSSDSYVSAGTRSYTYYDESTDKGIFYFNVEQSSDIWLQQFVVDDDGNAYSAAQYFIYNGAAVEKKNGYYNNSSVESYQPASYVIGSDICYFSTQCYGTYVIYQCSYSSSKGFTVTEPDGTQKTYADENAVNNSSYTNSLKKAIKSFKN